MSINEVPELLQQYTFDRRSGAGDHLDLVEFRAPGFFSHHIIHVFLSYNLSVKLKQIVPTSYYYFSHISSIHAVLVPLVGHDLLHNSLLQNDY